ncbi:uncharacterized protein LOC111404819 [Olea europaea var. sylvestris]|uniref:uncharacterized protein LOC111404819 n=1 Tax=Olea europaea var. sylvestris TaxID=158386 RepID=UPI000C1D7D74|nr:uncharacterized protein LOC111404819 [Olea europaea var. sylvestris]
MDEATKKANDMGIEAVFTKKRIIRRKKQFDESGSDEVKQSAEKSFKDEYFIFIIDQALSSLRSQFEQFKQYGCIYGKKFLKIEVDQDLSSIIYVTRKIKRLTVDDQQLPVLTQNPGSATALNQLYSSKKQPLCIILLSFLGFTSIKNIILLLKWISITFFRKPKNFKNDGSWAMITGSTDGIGKAFIVYVAKKCLNLILVSRNLSKLKNRTNEIQAKYIVIH